MKSTALYLLLLFWAVMLCFYVLLKANINVPAANSGVLLTEKLSPEPPQHPVAWLEQLPEQSAAAAFDKASLLPLQTRRLPLYHSFTCAGKLAGSKRSFSSLSSHFRILPNAP